MLPATWFPAGTPGLGNTSACPGDRKSTRLELQSQSNIVCRLLLEKKKIFLLVLILLFIPTLNLFPAWFALSLLRFLLPTRLPIMFLLFMVAMMYVIIPLRIMYLL